MARVEKNIIWGRRTLQVGRRESASLYESRDTLYAVSREQPMYAGEVGVGVKGRRRLGMEAVSPEVWGKVGSYRALEAT